MPQSCITPAVIFSVPSQGKQVPAKALQAEDPPKACGTNLSKGPCPGSGRVRVRSRGSYLHRPSPVSVSCAYGCLQITHHDSQGPIALRFSSGSAVTKQKTCASERMEVVGVDSWRRKELLLRCTALAECYKCSMEGCSPGDAPRVHHPEK